MVEVTKAKLIRYMQAEKEAREAKEELENHLDSLNTFAAVFTAGEIVRMQVASIDCIRRITGADPIVIPKCDDMFPFRAKGYIVGVPVTASMTEEQYEEYKKATAPTVTGEKL